MNTLAAVTVLADRGVDLDAVVALLVERGADLSVANRRGQTPLAIVARGLTGNVQAAAATVDLLRSLGAS